MAQSIWARIENRNLEELKQRDGKMSNSTVSEEGQNLAQPAYYWVSPIKFSLMSIVTFTIYDIYWGYKCWKYVKSRDPASHYWPFLTALFLPLSFYWLATDISRNEIEKPLSSRTYRIFLASSLFVINFSAWSLTQYWFIALFLFFIPILPAVSAIDRINNNRSTVSQRIHKWYHYALYAIVLPLLTVTILGEINYLPSTAVVEGTKLWNKDIEYLQRENILAEEEQILFFYSGGIFSISDDGQFLSQAYVTSYERDPEDDTLYVGYIAYEDIENVDVTWSESFLEDTVVTVTNQEDEDLILYLSAEGGGDHAFVDELNRQRIVAKIGLSGYQEYQAKIIAGTIQLDLAEVLAADEIYESTLATLKARHVAYLSAGDNLAKVAKIYHEYAADHLNDSILTEWVADYHFYIAGYHEQNRNAAQSASENQDLVNTISSMAEGYGVEVYDHYADYEDALATGNDLAVGANDAYANASSVATEINNHTELYRAHIDAANELFREAEALLENYENSSQSNK